ncbi:MAG: hypothetical protein AAFX81_21310 [Pseudomonadota bacterium]
MNYRNLHVRRACADDIDAIRNVAQSQPDNGNLDSGWGIVGLRTLEACTRADRCLVGDRDGRPVVAVTWSPDTRDPRCAVVSGFACTDDAGRAVDMVLAQLESALVEDGYSRVTAVVPPSWNRLLQRHGFVASRRTALVQARGMAVIGHGFERALAAVRRRTSMAVLATLSA